MSEAKFDRERSMTLIMTGQIYEVPDSDLEVLLEMAGYGIAYWASAMKVNGRKVTIIDSEDNTVYSTNYTALAQALVDIGTGAKDSGYAEYARYYLRDLTGDDDDKEYAAGHIDSDLADHVVQYAAFGNLVFG